MEDIFYNKYFKNTYRFQDSAINNFVDTIKKLESPYYSQIINNVNSLSNLYRNPLLECVNMQNSLSSLFKVSSVTIPKVESNIFKLINNDQSIFKQNMDAISRWTNLSGSWTNTYEGIINNYNYYQYPKYENMFYQSFIKTLNNIQFKEIDTEDVDIEKIDAGLRNWSTTTATPTRSRRSWARQRRCSACSYTRALSASANLRSTTRS
jgi:hypothetical protein